MTPPDLEPTALSAIHETCMLALKHLITDDCAHPPCGGVLAALAASAFISAPLEDARVLIRETVRTMLDADDAAAFNDLVAGYLEHEQAFTAGARGH